VFDTLFLGDALGGAERGERGRRCVKKSVAWEETAEVEGGVGEVVAGEPTAHLAYHVHIVIDARNDEVGELYPHARIAHSEDGVEDGLQTAAANFVVDGVSERLQIDIGGIEVGQKVI
jgi:hypothetical protein